MPEPVRRRAGFTLIELLVSVAMLGIVVVYLLRSFTVQHRTYTVVDETTELQQNLRAVADLVERDLRHAGMMVPESGAVCGVDDTAGPDVLFVSDADAILPGTTPPPRPSRPGGPAPRTRSPWTVSWRNRRRPARPTTRTTMAWPTATSARAPA
jgi:prepilin-type N-terminal cleavage/methylation domain-containing protein